MRALLIAFGMLGCGGSGSPAIDGAIGDGSRDDGTPGDGPGSDGSPLDGDVSPCPDGQWCMESSPVSGTLLTDIFALANGDVYAVGEAGTILRRRGGSWEQMTSNTSANLLGVWAAGPTDIWAVGGGGTILRSNGSVWTAVTDSGITADLDVVWGSSATDVWLAGTGAVHHWDGNNWSSQAFTGNYVALAGSGPSDVWAGGENAGPNLRHYTNAWGSVSHGLGTTTIFSLIAFAPNDVWAASSIPNKETVHFDGQAWTPRATMVGTIFLDMHGAPSDLWGVGASRAGRWNGSTWTVTQPLGGSASLHGVTGVGGRIWVVGHDSLIATYRD